MSEFFQRAYTEVEMLSRRPLLEQERVAVHLEDRVRERERLAELMEDVPTLKIDAEVYRFPKRKRSKPRAAPVVLRRLEAA